MEKNKTAIRQMVEYIQKLKDTTSDQSEGYMLTNLLVHAVHLMEVEKEQVQKMHKFCDQMERQDRNTMKK
jgi:hypothetical protein